MMQGSQPIGSGKQANAQVRAYGHYIGGQWDEAETHFDSFDPYTGEVWAKIARGNADVVDRAVAAARKALAGWSGMKASARGRLLTRCADVIDRHAGRLAEMEVRDNGKLLAEMSLQTSYIGEWFRYYGGLADKIEGSVIPTDKTDLFNFTRYEPMGVVGLITPWNSPLMLLCWKLAPALAAGNVAVIKPSEFTSVSTLEFMNVLEEAGLPPGVANVVTGFGSEVGTALVKHPDVDKIAFTGSDVTGQKIYESAAGTFKHVSLELGGKSPNIVFADADMAAATAGVVSGIFAANGQTCIAGSRLLVEHGVHDSFVRGLVAAVEAARIGNPMDLNTNIGPVANRPQFDKVMDYIAIAKAEGAKCILGGERYVAPDTEGGQFVKPTIFTNVNNRMRIVRCWQSSRSIPKTRRMNSPMTAASALVPAYGHPTWVARCAPPKKSGPAPYGSIPIVC
jgi:(Z)-2-((N-methylformamido)methylene)-5-hydroxybutyrolactone dehydrogenase